jgi:hypothetical protein
LYECLAISPQGGLLALADIDQGEAYIRVYRTPKEEGPLDCLGSWEDRSSNMITEMSFAPDGSALVWTLGSGYYWWTQSEDPEPSQGGRFRPGKVLIWRIARDEPGVVATVPIDVELPRGWLPKDPEDSLLAEVIQGPVFIDDHRFRILLPTGSWVTCDLEGSILQGPDSGEIVDVLRYATFRFHGLRVP